MIDGLVGSNGGTRNRQLRNFILYFNNGSCIQITGTTIENAIKNSHSSNIESTFAGLTCYEEGDKHSLFWNEERKDWFQIDARKQRLTLKKLWTE